MSTKKAFREEYKQITDIDYYNNLSREEALALDKETIIAALDVDDLYYGKFGQNWNSNSHLTKLLDDPLLEEPDEMWGDGKYLVIGNFIHKAFLEPEKAEVFPYSLATHRSQKIYKEDVAKQSEPWMFLKKDYDKWLDWVETMKKIPDVSNIIYDEDNLFEVPQVAWFNGIPIKGKCDIINHKKKLIIDIKTTSDLEGFVGKVDEWNYNVQAALYAKALYPDYDFRFLAIDKRTDKAGVFDMSPTQFEAGLSKLYRCTNLLKHYHLNNGSNVYYHYV